jgi:membrane protein DedA with SNARE-associated domain/rhodanese-related sulfurtransferase
MSELSAVPDRYLVWVLALNTLLHELGVPLPMLPTAIYAGARAAAGAVDPLALVVAVATGTTIGNAAWFAAGRRYGAGVLGLLCRFSLSPDACVGRTQGAFGRWGWSALVVGRFIPGVSLVAPPLAGALGMPWSKFLSLTLAGAALWGLVAVGAGVVFHAQVDAALQWIDALGWHAAGAVVIALAVYLTWRWWHRQRAARMLDIPRIDAAALRGMLDAGEAPVVVDLRGRVLQAADRRRIPGALALALDEIDSGLAHVPPDRPIVLYCACPNEASAAQAAQRLLSRGYVRAHPLRGGLDAWILAGHPIEHDGEHERGSGASVVLAERSR